MGGSRPPAFATSFGRLGGAAAPLLVPRRPPAPPHTLSLLRGRGHDEARDEATGIDGTRDRGAAARGVFAARGDGATAVRRATATATRTTIVALWCAAVLLGTPHFEGVSLPGVAPPTSAAFALESTDPRDPPPASPRPPAAAPSAPRYWDAMDGDDDDVRGANEKLVDRAVGTIAATFYDTSGGFDFDAQEFYAQWKRVRYAAPRPRAGGGGEEQGFASLAAEGLTTRENAVAALKSIVSSLPDPYSKYLTREELRMELDDGQDGFLGLGALVEAPASSPPPATPMFDTRQSGGTVTSTSTEFDRISHRPVNGGPSGADLLGLISLNHQSTVPASNGQPHLKRGTLSVADAANLPVVTAIIPDSPAERAGLVVGDRIAAVGGCRFTGISRSQIKRTLEHKFRAENYFGRVELTVATPVTTRPPDGGRERYDADGFVVEERYVFGEDGWYRPKRSRRGTADGEAARDRVLGYKLSHVKSMPTTLTAKLDGAEDPAGATPGRLASVIGGDAIVHFALLTPDDSIFQRISAANRGRPVGYIRLTRFSRSATEGYIAAVRSLEEAGAHSYIIDLRNNYGGVIQEAMLTASTLLRDPHAVLCYTLNSRGGFRPQEATEYVVDARYPGYLLSSEARTAARDQVRREHPEYLDEGGWGAAPTPYASLKELKATRGIRPASFASSLNDGDGGGSERSSGFSAAGAIDAEKLADLMARNSQKKLVILINEGTASAAEVFASALHDNGRTAALVGTRTFGKGLIQHTFPLPDGGGLRLTVAEYLTPSLQHVTKVGGAKSDSGVKPDVRCESKQGIPQNVGADLCVGVALDVLESAGG